MTRTASLLPLTDTCAPAEQAELADVVRRAASDSTPVYPLGGGTAVGYGLVPKSAGLGLSTERLNRVVDYPARDMTITAEAGVTLAELEKTLAAEGQYLPIDVAQPDVATLGGVMAVNFSGPHRYGLGTIRDYVIGVSAVDGTGTPFKAGGRVVKNVAGYDFCKLLTGSLGTLAVITQVTLKVRPRPAASVFLTTEVASFERAEEALAALVHSQTTPAAIELVAGDAWNDVIPLKPASASAARLVVGLEGTAAEVEWMVGRLRDEWASQGLAAPHLIDGPDAEDLWRRSTDFGCTETPTPWVLKFNVRPGRVCEIAALVRKTFPEASLAVRAGSGIVLAKLGDVPTHELAKPLIREFQPAAVAAGGQCVVFNTPSPEELTRQLAWGPARDDDAVMRQVKRQFDPQNLLNAGRFIF